MVKNQKQLQKPTNVKIIEVGKFYLIHDGSKSGHPGLVIWKDEKNGVYLLLKVGTSSNKNNTILKNNICDDGKCHYYYKKLVLAKKKDIGSKPYDDIRITNELLELAELLIIVSPAETKSIRRKDRYRFKKTLKNRPKTGVPLVKGNCPANKGST